jgi:hypothetical protein
LTRAKEEGSRRSLLGKSESWFNGKGLLQLLGEGRGGHLFQGQKMSVPAGMKDPMDPLQSCSKTIVKLDVKKAEQEDGQRF